MNDIDHSKANQMAELEAVSEAHTRQMSYLSSENRQSLGIAALFECALSERKKSKIKEM